jgi:hypothetical protein
MSTVFASYSKCGCNMGAFVIDRRPVEAARFAIEMDGAGYEVVVIPVEEYRERPTYCAKHAEVAAHV